jgi:hypothetical protein
VLLCAPPTGVIVEITADGVAKVKFAEVEVPAASVESTA